jgi:hypothetical protein
MRLIHMNYDSPPPSGRLVRNADVISDDVISHYAESDDSHSPACLFPPTASSLGFCRLTYHLGIKQIYVWRGYHRDAVNVPRHAG